MIRRLCLGAMALQLCQPILAHAQVAGAADPPPGTDRVYDYPDLRTERDLTLSLAGAGLLLAGASVSVDVLEVPPQGLDPGQIGWAADRRVVGNRSLSANTTSHWTRNAALVLPLVLNLFNGAPDARWRAVGRHGFVYAQTLLISQGLTLLGKNAFGRARPFAYLPVGQRPADHSYEVTEERAFASMPSGHSSSAWTGAAIGLTEHLLRRPAAGWVERSGIGFLGGALAGATSALRVAAGQHFPTDVLAGAGIGIASGVVVPLLHRGDLPLPPAGAWLQVSGGALAGTVVGILVAQGF